MSYDYELKKMIQKEKDNYKVPEHYKNRVKALLEELPEKKERNIRQLFLKQAVVYVMILLLSSVTVAAGIVLVHLGKGKIQYRNSSRKYREIISLKEIQENNGQVNITRKSQGISFTIENIGLDQGNLLVYYKIHTDHKIEFSNSDWAEKQEKMQSVMLDLQIVLDGEQLTNISSADEIYMVNDKTVRGVFRQNISRDLRERVSLEIKPGTILDVNGNWDIHMTIDRSGVNDQSKRFIVSNEIVSSVVLSPFGNILEIKDGYENKEFVLRDSKQRYLYYKLDSLGEDQPSYANFFGDMVQTDYLELVPIKKHTVKKTKDGPEIISMKLKNDQTVALSQRTRLKVRKIEQSKELLRVYFQVLSYDKADLTLGIEHLNVKTWMNEENSLLVMDIYDIEGKKDMSKMKELYFLQQEITLDEKSAIKINLKK